MTKPTTGRLGNLAPRPQYLPPATPEAQAIRAALQERQAQQSKCFQGLDLSPLEERAHRHPSTNIGE